MRALLAPLASVLTSGVLLLLVWIGFLRVFHVNPLIGQPPSAVAHYLLAGPAAAHHRLALWRSLSATLGHAGLGFVVGLLLGACAAVAFELSPALRRALMPVATILRSVPLVALTPLIVLLFGRGLAAICVIGAIITFFPTLVTLSLGLRSAPPLAGELVRAYGGGRWTVLRRIQLPSAAGALFASMRLSVPQALVAALLAEWLATGNGLGYRLQRDITTFRSVDLWSGVVVLTLCSVILYGALGLIEEIVLTLRNGGTRRVR